MENAFKILELVQWIKPQNLRNFNLDTYQPKRYRGRKDSPNRFKSIHYLVEGHYASIREVGENHSPILGYVWYRKSPDGKLVIWKQNIDSSG